MRPPVSELQLSPYTDTQKDELLLRITVRNTEAIQLKPFVTHNTLLTLAGHQPV